MNVYNSSQAKQINATDKRDAAASRFEALVAGGCSYPGVSYYQGSASLNRDYRSRPSTRGVTFIRVYTPRDTKKRCQFYCTPAEITSHSTSRRTIEANPTNPVDPVDKEFRSCLLNNL